MPFTWPFHSVSGPSDSLSHFGCIENENRYAVDRLVGQGSYGSVAKGRDKMSGKLVAIKHIPIPDDGPESISQKTARELLILHSLRHEHILCLTDFQIIGSNMYIITDFCDVDLINAMHLKKHRDLFAKIEPLRILYQTLQGIHFMHSLDVLHRDIKPSNILIDSKLNVKVCDFGLSRVVKNCDYVLDPKEEALTEYMVTRWYRAPEVVLNPGKYGKAQDIWAVAATVGELLCQQPIFPGKTLVHQLQVIIDVIGEPTENDLNFQMSPRSLAYIKSLKSQRIGLNEVLSVVNPVDSDLSQLLGEMLRFNPKDRITTEAAISSPVFYRYEKLHNYNSYFSDSMKKSALDLKIPGKWPQSNRQCLDRLREELQVVREDLDKGVYRVRMQKGNAEDKKSVSSSRRRACSNPSARSHHEPLFVCSVDEREEIEKNDHKDEMKLHPCVNTASQMYVARRVYSTGSRGSACQAPVYFKPPEDKGDDPSQLESLSNNQRPNPRPTTPVSEASTLPRNSITPITSAVKVLFHSGSSAVSDAGSEADSDELEHKAPNTIVLKKKSSTSLSTDSHSFRSTSRSFRNSVFGSLSSRSSLSHSTRSVSSISKHDSIRQPAIEALASSEDDEEGPSSINHRRRLPPTVHRNHVDVPIEEEDEYQASTATPSFLNSFLRILFSCSRSLDKQTNRQKQYQTQDTQKSSFFALSKKFSSNFRFNSNRNNFDDDNLEVPEGVRGFSI